MESVNKLKKYFRSSGKGGVNGHSKSQFLYLWNERYECGDGISISFSCINYRFPEIVWAYIKIPISNLSLDMENPSSYSVLIEDAFLRFISPEIYKLSDTYKNINKELRSYSEIKAQVCSNVILKRSGIFFIESEQCLVLKVWIRFPLNGVSSINGTRCAKLITDLMQLINTCCLHFDHSVWENSKLIYDRQQEIREYITKHNLIAFVANGSILPRENNTQKPMKNAVPFQSPKNLEIEIHFKDGSSILGMGIPEGITVITGGGYSGKSTLLNALESGIYNHIPGDGREFVITNDSALKISVEDGRPVQHLNLTPFFQNFSINADLNDFSTVQASGSVSQAANVIEALNAGSKLLLIDEDKSANNFMIRDSMMRWLVPKEPIIPFTDRIREIYKCCYASIILVIGGSSEYLKYADHIILMENHVAKDITDKVRSRVPLRMEENYPIANWYSKRYLQCVVDRGPLFFKTISTHDTRKIILDKYIADVTMMTSIISTDQLNFLASMLEQLLSNTLVDVDIMELIRNSMDFPFSIKTVIEMSNDSTGLISAKWCEKMRSIDVYCCLCRLRGVVIYS